MSDPAKALFDVVADVYPVTEWPTLSQQYERWRDERPLVGVTILDGTPAMRNTAAKYLPLVAGGAHVAIGVSPTVPYDRTVVGELANLARLSVLEQSKQIEADVVLDCAGTWAHIPARFGYAELTRSGVDRYRNCPLPVIIVDSGHVKQLENYFGTGDGFVRALAKLGYEDLTDRRVTIFGAGKVGRGIANELNLRGSIVTVVDDAQKAADVPESIPVDRFDERAVESTLDTSWCVVTATGVVGAVAQHAHVLTASDALLANMGVEDEFGPGVPGDRVLNQKRPLNFILDEPTRLAFLDPTFTLSNACAVKLVDGDVQPGMSLPDGATESAILDQWYRSFPDRRLPHDVSPGIR